MRTEVIRSEIRELVRQKPFHPFSMNMENGDRIIVEHPENIAFNPEAHNGDKKWAYFYVISADLRYYGTFEAVTSIAMLDREDIERH